MSFQTDIFFFSGEQILAFTGVDLLASSHTEQKIPLWSLPGHKSGFYLFIRRTGKLKCNSEKGSFFYELRASHCSDMNAEGFELQGRRKK